MKKNYRFKDFGLDAFLASEDKKIFKERKMEIRLKLKYCVLFCVLMIALGAAGLLWFTPQSRYGNLTFSVGLIWLVAGALPLMLFFKWFWIDQKIKKLKEEKC